MKRHLTILAVAWAVPALAFAQDFSVGDRVHVGSLNEDGTVLMVGGKIASTGGTQVKVHLDRFGADNPTSSVIYDTALSHVTRTGGTAPVAAAPRPIAPPPSGPPALQGTPVSIAAATKLSPDLCKQLIRGNYPAGGDYSQTVSFLVFDMGGARDYEDIAANSSAGLLAKGRHVSSSPVHAKFTVLKHYQNPNAPDELRTYDAKYECFKSPVTNWTVKMISRLPGGETAQYINKR